MKILLLSDIHGSRGACQQALQVYHDQQAERLILLGDLLNHGPRNPLPLDYDPPAVAESLNRHSAEILAVRGNCDNEADQTLLDFNIKADYNVLQLPDRRIFLSHGHIYDPQHLPPTFGPGDVFLFGHIHLPLAEKQEDYYLGNPGSCALPHQGYPPSYGLLTPTNFTVYDFSGKTLAMIAF